LESESKEKVRIYYDSTGYVTDEKNSLFFMEGKITDDFQFQDTIHLFYSKSGKSFGRELYKNGKINGPFVYYHENGNLKERGIYRNSLKLGYTFTYYPSGKPHYTFFYPEKKGSGSDCVEYDFMIINYWDINGIQIINNGNGYCECQVVLTDYALHNFIINNSGNPNFILTNISFHKNEHHGLSNKYEVILKGKVKDGLRDSTWTAFDMKNKILYKENFSWGNLTMGESYFQNKIIKYGRFIETIESHADLLFAFQSGVTQSIRCLDVPKLNGIRGTVKVEFTVDQKGNCKDFNILNGLNANCDKAVINSIRGTNLKIFLAKKRGLPLSSRLIMDFIIK